MTRSFKSNGHFEVRPTVNVIFESAAAAGSLTQYGNFYAKPCYHGLNGTI
jgi:hypothetical protein